jgi:hypothetical protein
LERRGNPRDADLPISGVGSSIFQGHFCS